MKPKHLFLLLIITLAAVALSACSAGAVMNNSWPGLATDGEHVYLAAGQFVYAIRMNDGQRVWQYPAKADNKLQFIADPAVTEDGTVIVGSVGSDHHLISLDPSVIDSETGTPQVKWMFTEAKDRYIAAPLVVGDRVFAPNTDGNLYVLGLEDGFSTKKALQVIEVGGPLWAQPVTDGSRIYVTSLDHHLHAFDLETYRSVWNPVDLGGAAPGSPLVGPNGNVYVGSFNSELIKVDPATGAATSFASAQGWVWGTPVLWGDMIYFGDLEGNLYGVDVASGQTIWSIQPNGPIVGSPRVLDEYLVFATESGSVYAVDRDGKIAWQRDIGGRIFTVPVTGENRIVVAPMEADFLLAALDTQGNRVWTFSLDE